MVLVTVIGEAFIAIKPQTQGFEKELQSSVGASGAKVAKTLAATIGSAFVLTKIKSFAQAGIAELKDAAAAQAQTAAAIKSTGGAAGVTAEQVGQMSERLLKVSGVDDELIQKGANLLLTFTKVRNEVGKGNDIFDRATEAALDLSRAGFGSVESASTLLGKALNDPITGMRLLRRSGVLLSESQQDLIKSLVASGDQLGAQKILLDEIDKKVGGSAEAYGKTLAGQIDIANESMANMKGQMVAGLAPALTFTADAATFLTEQFAKQPEAVQAIEGAALLAVGALGSIVTPLKSAVDLWRSFGTTAAAAASVAGATIGNTSASVENLYQSSGRAAAGFGRAAVTAGALGVAVVGIVTAVQLLGDGIEKANLTQLQRDLLDFVESGELSGEALDVLGGNVEDLSNSLGLLEAGGGTGAMLEFGEATDQATQRVDDIDKALAGLAGQSPEAAAAALKAITDALPPEQADLLVSSLNDYDDAIASSEVSSRLAAGAVGEFGEAATGATEPAEQLTRGTFALGDAQDDLTRDIKGVNDKLLEEKELLDEMFGATQSAIDSGFAYEQAVNASEDALAEYAATQKDGKATTEDLERAELKAAESLVGVSDALLDGANSQAELTGATIDQVTQADIQIGKLKELQDKVGKTSPLGQRLQGTIDQLQGFKSRAIRLDADITPAQRQIGILLGLIPAVVGIRADITYSGPSYRRALGGIIPEGGAAYLAGGGFPGWAMGSDTVPTWLTPGEFVNTKQTVDRLGVDFFNALNNGATPGGSTIVAQTTAMSEPLVQNIYTTDPVEAASEAARRHRAYRNALTLR